MSTTSEKRCAFSLMIGRAGRDSRELAGSTNHGTARTEVVHTFGMTLICVMAVVKREKEYNNTT